MRRRVIRWAALLLVLSIAPAVAYVEFRDATNTAVPGYVDMSLNGAGQAVARSQAAVTMTSTPVSVGTSSVQIAAAGTMTKGWVVQNTTLAGGGYIDLCLGATCTLGSGFLRVYSASSRSQLDTGNILPPVGTAMSAIASAASQTLVITVSN